MPIGKNAIKRVENNGYSNVASSAPDMENSVVAEPALTAETLPDAKTTSDESAKRRRGRPAKGKVSKEAAELTQTAVKAPKKEETAETKTTKAANKQEKPARKTYAKAVKKEKNGFERVELGGDMPYWLL